MKTIVIIDYGLGNLTSVFRGIERCGGVPVISSDIEVLRSAEAVILPGVGAFRDGMEQLGEMKDALLDAARSVPVLGICLGMQMMLEWSEEHGMHKGLCLIPGTVRRFPRQPGFKVPHMGWNDMVLDRPHPVLAGLATGDHAYFVHSYRFQVADPAHLLAHVEYGGPVTAIVGRDTILGTQFHPEKSQAAGLRLIGNFLGWRP